MNHKGNRESRVSKDTKDTKDSKDSRVVRSAKTHQTDKKNQPHHSGHADQHAGKFDRRPSSQSPSQPKSSSSQSRSHAPVGARDKAPNRHEERMEYRTARRSQLHAQGAKNPHAAVNTQRLEGSAGADSPGAERIQKVLAREGLGSRRDLERLIYDGHVVVNAVVAQLGDKVVPGDKIIFQGREILFDKPAGTPQILVYHKPPGEICSQKDPEDRPSVFDRIPQCSEGRWVMVGRLDFNSCGLLMFTNSGELANQLMHPKYQIEREYAVRIFGELSDEHIDRLLKGIRLEDGFAKFKSVVFGGGEGKNRWYNVVLTEGRNREIRRMFEAVGFTVSRLMRIRFGTVQLPSTLLQGKRALLPDNQVVKLMDLLNQQNDAVEASSVKMHIHSQKMQARKKS